MQEYTEPRKMTDLEHLPAFPHVSRWFLNDVDSTSTRFKHHHRLRSHRSRIHHQPPFKEIQGVPSHCFPRISLCFSSISLAAWRFKGGLRWFVVMVYPAASLDGKPHSAGL